MGGRWGLWDCYGLDYEVQWRWGGGTAWPMGAPVQVLDGVCCSSRAEEMGEEKGAAEAARINARVLLSLTRVVRAWSLRLCWSQRPARGASGAQLVNRGCISSAQQPGAIPWRLTVPCPFRDSLCKFSRVLRTHFISKRGKPALAKHREHYCGGQCHEDPVLVNELMARRSMARGGP